MNPGLSDVTGRRAVDLFGVPVDALTMDETVTAARRMVAAGSPHQHVVVNAAKIVELRRNPALAEVIRSCDLVNADGKAVVWASRILGSPLPERVAGIDLFERLVEAAHHDGSSVYFLGARPEIVSTVAEVLTTRHPGLRVAGYHDGYWPDDEAMIAEVRSARPDYVFLAIPSPRKEFWLNKNLRAIDAPFVMGVGGSFDVIAGKVGRAPRWVQKAGMEWVWRVGQEPRRLAKRYLVGNTAFIAMTVSEWWKGRRR